MVVFFGTKKTTKFKNETIAFMDAIVSFKFGGAFCSKNHPL